jgi:hypothetical protein
VEGRKKKKFNKNGNSPAGPGVDPWPAGDRWSPASPRPPTCRRRLLVAELPATSGRDLVARPRPGSDRWSPPAGRQPRAGQRPAVACRPRVDAWTCWAIPIFLKFFYFLKMNFWKFGKWAKAFGRMGVQRPHFLKLAPTLGSGNSSKIHGEWRFHFFSNFLFPKFSSYLDLHIYRWDFCFMRKLIP